MTNTFSRIFVGNPHQNRAIERDCGILSSTAVPRPLDSFQDHLGLLSAGALQTHRPQILRCDLTSTARRYPASVTRDCLVSHRHHHRGRSNWCDCHVVKLWRGVALSTVEIWKESFPHTLPAAKIEVEFTPCL